MLRLHGPGAGRLASRAHTAATTSDALSIATPALRSSRSSFVGVRSLSSSGGPPKRVSALITPQQQIEAELALSTARREERIRRLEELEQLESLLHQQKVAEGASFWWTLGVHWRTHGPAIAAFVCGATSMSASFALWKSLFFHNKEKTEIEAKLVTIEAEQQEIARSDARELKAAQDRLQAYRDSKVVVVSVPSDPSSTAATTSATAATPTSRGWFGFLSSSSKSTVSSTPDGVVSGRVWHHTSLAASQQDLAQIAKIQQEVQQAYA